MMVDDRPVILVTGASGFVGRWLIPALVTALPEAQVIGTATAPAEGQGLVPLDVRDHRSARSLIAQLKPTAVVNLAAFSVIREAEQDPSAAFDVNMFGPMRLAEAVLDANPACRFLFIGSSEVYGGTFRDWRRPLDESAPLDPMNLYATAKAAGDLAIGQLGYRGLKAVRFRPFNHTGPGQSDRFALAAFIAQIDRIEQGLQPPLIQVGNLDAERDFVDVRDIVRAYVTAIARPEPLPNGTIINLASGRPTRIGTLLDHLLSQAKVSIRVRHDPERIRAWETPLVVGDASRARDLLGWQAAIPVERTLDDMLHAVRALR